MSKKLLAIAALFIASFAPAQTHVTAMRDTANTFTGTPNQFTKGVQAGPVPFANLSNPALVNQGEGTLVWVTDAVAQNPCVGSGTGAFAFRQNGAWNCAVTSSGSGSGTVNAGTINHLYKNVAPSTVGDSTVVDNGSTVSTTLPFSASTLTSTIAIGTAPLTVTSTTVVPNLNVSQLLGATWASPGNIGTGTPGTGAFTTLSSTTTATVQNLTINGTCTGCLTGGVVLNPTGDQVISGGFDLQIADGGTISGEFGQAIFFPASGNLRWQTDVSEIALISAANMGPPCTNLVTPTGCVFITTANTPFVFSHGLLSSHTGGAIFPGEVNGSVGLFAPDAGGNHFVVLPSVDGVLAVLANPANFTSLQLANITSTPQCLQADALGNITGTGVPCGSGGGGGTWGSITGILSAQTDLQTALNAKLNTGLAVLFTPAASQTIQPSGAAVIGLITKCPAGAAGTLACFQAVDNSGANILSALQNDTVQFGTGVGGQITLTDIVGPNSNPATAGQVRVSTTDSAVCWRSNDNTVNYCLAKTAANIITSDLALAVKETAAGSGIAGYGVLYEDSGTHIPMWSANNGSFLVIPQETGSMTSGHLVSVNATTNLLQDSGLALSSVLLGTPTNHAVLASGAAQTVTMIGPGTSGQCFLSNGASADPSYQTCPSGGGATLDAVTAAVGAATINNGDNAIRWNFQGTTASRTSFLFSENTASTSTGTPVLLAARTIASSTMNPFEASANGNGLRMDTTGKLGKIGTGSVDVAALSSTTGSGAAMLATSPTSVTLDAEGTSNVITRPFYVEYEASCNNTTASTGSFGTPTATAATASCFGTTTTQGAMDFIDGSTTVAVGHFTLPQGWTGNFDARLIWFTNAASSNAVRWSVQTGCVADTEAISTGPSYNTASQSNTAYTGTALQRKTTTLSAISMTNCSAGETMYFQVSRIGGDAGDTLVATAELVSLQFEGRSTK